MCARVASLDDPWMVLPSSNEVCTKEEERKKENKSAENKKTLPTARRLEPHLKSTFLN